MVGGKEPAGVPMTHFYLKGNKQLVLHFLIYALPFKNEIFSEFIEFLAICGDNLTFWILQTNFTAKISTGLQPGSVVLMLSCHHH